MRNLIRAGVPQKVAMMISGHKTTSMFSRNYTVGEQGMAALRLAQEGMKMDASRGTVEIAGGPI